MGLLAVDSVKVSSILHADNLAHLSESHSLDLVHVQVPDLTRVLQDTLRVQNSDGIPSAHLEAEWPPGVSGETRLQISSHNSDTHILWVSAYLHASAIHQRSLPPRNASALSCSQSLWYGTHN